MPDFPFAVTPLWQVAQLPGLTPEWLNEAGVHAEVLWQVSQLCVVAMWLAFLPRAAVPLWQLVQDPAATAAWLKVAGVHPVVR